MTAKHRVILMLDAEQLCVLHRGLASLQHNDPEHTKSDRDEHFFSKLCNLVLTAKEVCENRDRADEAERRLSQLVAEKVMQ